MRREALIIGSPDAGIPGVRVDMRNWESFLASGTGGAWNGAEVRKLENPTTFALKSMLSTVISKSDYAFITFSGHGYVDESGRTVLQINDRETILATELIATASRQTIVIDCCRVPVRSSAVLKESARIYAADSASNRQLLRQKFDRAVADCDPGLIRLYSCSVGETAGESPSDGGIYTHSLIRAAEPVSRVKSVRQAHDEAKILTTKQNPGQTPTSQYPRSTTSFPFSVS